MLVGTETENPLGAVTVRVNVEDPQPESVLSNKIM